VCGDFYAKLDCNQDYAPIVISLHGFGEISKKGVRLIDFCATNDIIVGGTWYPYKPILKYKWNSTNGTT